MVQDFRALALPAGASAGFPFEKLAPELQRMIIREAVLGSCLTPRISPTNPYYQHWSRWSAWQVDENESWPYEEHKWFFNYLKGRKDKPQHAGGSEIPLHLLRVSRTIADITRSVCAEDTLMVINVTPLCFHFLQTVMNRKYTFPTFRDFAQVAHFKVLPNFQLDLNFHHRWWRRMFRKSLVEDAIVWWTQPKEWLRTVCDILATNDSIEKLSVRLPCFCSLTSPERLMRAEIIMTDLLRPLERLRVNSPVQFIWHRMQDSDINHWNGSTQESQPCTKSSLGENLVKTLQKHLGRLDGKKLTPQEETWKNIKAIPRVRECLGGLMTKKHEHALRNLHDAISRMPPIGLHGSENKLDKDDEGSKFDAMAIGVEEKFWSRWEKHKQRRRKGSGDSGKSVDGKE
ncbi:MAG: hypothetical protein Q9168_003491 [Polycauliona sp. 1 TL-2023]